MILTIGVYSTNPKSLEKELNAALPYIKQTKGIEDVKISIQKVVIDKPVLERGKDGGIRLDDRWMLDNIFTNPNYMVNCLHISSKERDKWGLKHPKPNTKLAGSYYLNNGDTSMDMVIIGEVGKRAPGYKMNKLTKTFIHELSHAFSHWLMQFDHTHIYDYDKKAIDKIFMTYDFTNWKKLKGIYEWLKSYLRPKQVTSLYAAAVSFIGKDASPNDLVSDELGCAESVSNVIKVIRPDFPIITGTWTLWKKMETDLLFKKVTKPEPGDIIISPTGSVANAPFPGHVGIVGKDGVVMSNNSYTGIFEPNFTLTSWKARYTTRGRYPIYYYRLA